MTNLEILFQEVDALKPEELNRLYDYIQQRRRTTWWVVPPENLEKIADVLRPVRDEAEQMSDAEINAAIDEAIAEARRERNRHQSRD
jgi:uncharacterized protein YfkK (UPF0435 family)